MTIPTQTYVFRIMTIEENKQKFWPPWPSTGSYVETLERDHVRPLTSLETGQTGQLKTKQPRLGSAVAAAWVSILLAIQASSGEAGDKIIAYSVVDGMIPISLTDEPGDPKRGREIAAGRVGNCLACHKMPISEKQFHGDLGPNLYGVGTRFTEGELRIRLVDPKLVNSETIMPAFYKVSNLRRVKRRYLGQPILDAQAIEDLVAYLKTLKQFD